MNLHLLFGAAELSADDRAALQSLIPLAGAVGAGTIFSLFAGSRRGAALRVFEVFAIVAVLTAAALTAALSIDLLHAGEAISNKDLTQTAMPLVIATLLLVVVSVFNRVNESIDRLLVLLPMVGVAIFAAAELMISSWSVSPGSAIWVVMLIFLVGIALSLCGWAVDLYESRSSRHSQQRRIRRVIDRGCAPVEIALKPTLPTSTSESPTLTGWARGDAKLLDYTDAERLRDLVRARWDALAAGEAAGPIGDSILLDVQLEHWARSLRRPANLRVVLLRPREKDKEQIVEITAGDDRLFDVTDLVI